MHTPSEFEQKAEHKDVWRRCADALLAELAEEERHLRRLKQPNPQQRARLVAAEIRRTGVRA